MESDIYYSGRKKDVLNTPVRGFGLLFNQQNVSQRLRMLYLTVFCVDSLAKTIVYPHSHGLYDDFEQHLGESITPSMYRFMAEYVRDNISNEDLYVIQTRGDEYCPDDHE